MLLIKPFTATVNNSGQAVLQIGPSLQGITWTVQQIGFGLGKSAVSPKVAAHVNGVPLAATVVMQPSVFASILGQAPYAMETFFVGPPYIDLSAGDAITCAVLGATAGDTFTAAAYIEEDASGQSYTNLQPYRPPRWR